MMYNILACVDKRCAKDNQVKFDQDDYLSRTNSEGNLCMIQREHDKWKYLITICIDSLFSRSVFLAN